MAVVGFRHREEACGTSLTAVSDRSANLEPESSGSALRSLRQPSSLRVLLLLAGLAALAMGIGGLLPATAAADGTSTSAGSEARLPAAVPEPAAPTGAGPEQVWVGMHLNRVLDINLESGTYVVDFFIWLKWNGALDPAEGLDYLNSVDELVKNQPAYPEPTTLADGTKYQAWHVQGRFANVLNFREFPRDVHNLVIQVEDNVHPASELVYVASGVSQSDVYADLPDGWRLADPATADVRVDEYNTTFGTGQIDDTRYSEYQVTTPITKPIYGYLIRAILPIVVVMLIALAVYFLSPDRIDARLGIGVTALISAVLLRDSAVAGLPDVPYFVRVDAIFLCSYMVIFAAIAQSVVAVRLDARGQAAGAARLDRYAAVVSALVFGAVLVAALAV